jgi:hypothetical protein
MFYTILHVYSRKHLEGVQTPQLWRNSEHGFLPQADSSPEAFQKAWMLDPRFLSRKTTPQGPAGREIMEIREVLTPNGQMDILIRKMIIKRLNRV